MRNKLFILICFIFIFGFSMNVWAADPDFYFEISNGDFTLYNGLCSTRICKFYCKNNSGVTDYQNRDNANWGSQPEDSKVVASYNDGLSCKEGSKGITKFYIDTLKDESQFDDLKKYLINIKCGDADTTCLSYLYKNYCSKFSSSNICVKLGENSGSSIETVDGQTCNLPIHYVKPKNQSDDFIALYRKTTNTVSFYIPNLNPGVDGSDDYGENGVFKSSGNTIHMYSLGSNFTTFKSNYQSKYDENSSCPVVSFCCEKGDTRSWYAELASSCPSDKGYGSCEQTVSDNGASSGVTLVDPGELDYTGKLIKNGGVWKSLSCSDIIPEGSKTQELLKTIINMIKIAVPVLLLVFGVIDFGSAIFAQEEGNIKKAQGKFIKRLIIAVIIFLIPSILNVILSIAHTVWPNISPDFCGIL